MGEMHLYNEPGKNPPDCGWVLGLDAEGHQMWVGRSPDPDGVIDFVEIERMNEIIRTTGCVPLMSWEVDLYNNYGKA